MVILGPGSGKRRLLSQVEISGSGYFDRLSEEVTFDAVIRA